MISGKNTWIKTILILKNKKNNIMDLIEERISGIYQKLNNKIYIHIRKINFSKISIQQTC